VAPFPDVGLWFLTRFRGGSGVRSTFPNRFFPTFGTRILLRTGKTAGSWKDSSLDAKKSSNHWKPHKILFFIGIDIHSALYFEIRISLGNAKNKSWHDIRYIANRLNDKRGELEAGKELK
jgi:hypothetical protein